MIGAFVLQLFQFLLVLLLAPGLTGLVRKAKARLLGRRGPPVCCSPIATCCACCARRR